MIRRLIPGLLLACIPLYADDYADLFRQAAAFSQHGMYDQAIAKYKAALAMRPGAPC